MARRDYRQFSLADALLDGRKRKQVRLERLHEMHELIAWEAIDALLAAINSAHKGADGYPPLCLFKALLLSIWYNLSHAKLEEALADRLSFRKFCGFPLDAQTPDETTFVRFRKTLRERKLHDEAHGPCALRQMVAKASRVGSTPRCGKFDADRRRELRATGCRRGSRGQLSACASSQHARPCASFHSLPNCQTGA